MFTYSFKNNTGAPISIKGRNSVGIVIPAHSSYVIKVGDSCPVQYKVELYKAKKVFNTGIEMILALRKIHEMLKRVSFDYEIVLPEVKKVEVKEPSKSEEIPEEVQEVAEEVSVVTPASTSVSEDLSSLRVLEFNPVMYVGKPEKILVKVDGDGRAINFKSSNKNVATVTRFGNVYPQAPGVTEITVTFNDASKVLKLEVIQAEEDHPEEE